MVKIGFIVEGDTEKVIIDSSNFKEWMKNKGLEMVENAIDAKGGGNLLPKNINPFINQLIKKDAQYILVLTDSEGKNPDDVRKRIENYKIDFIFIAIKAIEAHGKRI